MKFLLKIITLTNRILVLLLSIIPFFKPSSIYAQTPVPPINLMATEDFPFASKTLSYYLSPLLRTSIIGAGVISFLLIIGAGLTIISSAGNPQKQTKGKGAATAGVMGLILVISAYWIIQIIEVLTGIDILESPL